jgi:hypothetical protein
VTDLRDQPCVDFMCGAFQPLGLVEQEGQLLSYRCTEPHNHQGSHQADIDGETVATWGRLS